MTKNDQKLETVVCDLCGADDYEVLYRELFPLVRCRRCGLCYVNPRPHPVYLIPFDEAAYAKTVAKYAHKEHPRRDMFAFFLDRIKQLLGPVKEPLIVDIGAHCGHFLEVAREKGFTPVGVELEPTFVKFAREHMRLEYYDREIEKFPELRNRADAITSYDVIEHVQSPRRFLAACHDVLKDGGLLLLKTPNVKRVLFVKAILSALRMKMHTLYTDGHFYQFSEQTLRRYLEEAGFRDIRFVTLLPFYKHDLIPVTRFQPVNFLATWLFYSLGRLTSLFADRYNLFEYHMVVFARK
jgi:2-polyprenyl-3-methyl-5-hydroxy-6-metoxy-1,4-benzoquinol methylase